MMDKNLIKQLRAETPACSHILHFNNAGAALPPNCVTQAVKDHLDLEARIGGYEAQSSVADILDQFYENAATLIHCKPEEIAFLDNATRAWEMAFFSFQFKSGDRILTTKTEYASNFIALMQVEQRYGIEIIVIGNDADGQIDLEAFEKNIDERVRLVSLTHIPTHNGLINPAKEVGAITRKYNIPYLLDATQSVGQIPVNVNEIGCDFLCATGRKYLRGPRGTGFLYARHSRISECIPPFIDLHAAIWTEHNKYILRNDAKRFETWEQNIAAKIGLKTAIDYAVALGENEICDRIKRLATSLREQLVKTPKITIQDLGKNKGGIVTFTVADHTPQEIQQYCAARKINVSVSLQEYARLDMSERHLPAVVRASVHYYNTEEEIERFCLEISRI